MPRKILIVGAGLAGTLTAWELKKRGVDVTLCDNNSSSASKVAAGLFNPVSFKRVIEVWNASEHMAQMQETYTEIEEELGVQFLNSAPILRVFPNSQYRDHWQSRLDKDHEVARWISKAYQSSDAPEGVEAPEGFGLVKDAGWVNLPVMTSAIIEYFKSFEAFKEFSWSISDGIPSEFDAVVDCRGVGAKSELNSMGYRLAGDHGEVLTLKSPTLDLAGMTLNRVKWLMPFAENTFKLGATYEWHVPISEPTESGKLELLDAISPALSPQISSSLEVINHQSGLRPTTHDRRPYIGALSDEPGVYIVNGLGTRGVLIAPTIIKKFIASLSV